MNIDKSGSESITATFCEEVKAIKHLTSSRHSIYMAVSLESNTPYALKAYFFEQDKISSAFLQEKKVKKLKHENIISLVDSVPKKKSQHEKYFSYNLFEFAPYGNLAEFMVDTTAFEDKVLVRTIFHQIINGVEYLHSKGISHMDLKMTNLLIGKDYKIKIIDFEFAHFEDDYRNIGKGTAGYRAPEVKVQNVRNHKAADIYSLGIILFCLYTGNFPYIEKRSIDGYNFEAMVLNQDPEFWDAQVEVTKIPEIRSEELKKLFWSMVKRDADERITIQEVKKSEWFNGEVYGDEAYKSVMSSFFN